MPREYVGERRGKLLPYRPPAPFERQPHGFRKAAPVERQSRRQRLDVVDVLHAAVQHAVRRHRMQLLRHDRFDGIGPYVSLALLPRR